MTSLRRAVVASALAWVAMHIVLGALYVGATSFPALYVFAMVLAAVATYVAVEPLLPVVPMPRRVAAALLVVTSLGSSLAVLPHLTGASAATYASWPMGASGVAIAGLVLRGPFPERLTAVVLAIAQAVVPWAALTWWSDGLEPVDALYLAIPPLLWLAASLGVDVLVRRTDVAVSAYWLQTAGSAAAMLAAQDEEAVVAHRLAEVRRRAAPILRRLADGEPVDDQLAADAAVTATALRDDLRARSVLDDRVRAVLAAARGRGADVVLVADPLWPGSRHDRLAATTIATLLDEVPRLAAGDRLECHVTAEPPTLVLAVSTPTGDERLVRRSIEV